MPDIIQEPLKPEVMKLPETTEHPGVIITPPGFSAISMESFITAFHRRQPAPQRRTGTYMAADIESLLAWVNANCPPDTPLFAEGAETLAESWREPELALVAIGNYSDLTNPRWHDFQGRYEFPVTKAWKAWTTLHGEWLKQGQFAEFVEEHLHEFTSPLSGETPPEAVSRMIAALGGAKYVATSNDMYTLAHGVKLYVNQEVEVTLDRATGEQMLHFAETHTGKGDRPVPIPKFFFVRLPIFFGEPSVLVGALLRYRNAGGGVVMWSYELFAPDQVVKDAFDAACELVRQTGRKLYLGSPDTPD